MCIMYTKTNAHTTKGIRGMWLIFTGIGRIIYPTFKTVVKQDYHRLYFWFQKNLSPLIPKSNLNSILRIMIQKISASFLIYKSLNSIPYGGQYWELESWITELSLKNCIYSDIHEKGNFINEVSDVNKRDKHFFKSWSWVWNLEFGNCGERLYSDIHLT